MANVYTCRKCHKSFEAKPEEKDITWCCRSRNFYYHKECWEEYIKRTKEKNSEEWFDLIFDLITRELGKDYNFFLIKKQAEKFINNGYTMKGIYFSLYWYHIIQQKEYQSHFGIGIVPHIYEEATTYWCEQMKRTQNVLEEIERIKTQEAAEGITVSKRKSRRAKRSEEPIF